MQRFAEIAILSMVTIAFVVVGLRSAAIIKSALRTLATAEVVLVNKRSAAAANNHGGRDMQAIVDLTNSAKLVAEASDRGRLMKVKIVRTFMFIFLTCLVRSAVTFWFGIVSAAQDWYNPCSANACDACKNVYSHMISWVLYTPALQMLVLLVCAALGANSIVTDGNIFQRSCHLLRCSSLFGACLVLTSWRTCQTF